MSFNSLGPIENCKRPQQEPEAILFHVWDREEFWNEMGSICYLLHVCCSLKRRLEVRLSEQIHWEPNSSRVGIYINSKEIWFRSSNSAVSRL